MIIQRILLLTSFLFLHGFAWSDDAWNGLNLPPTQGRTNDGAFLPGIYQYNYTERDLARVKTAGFTHLRIPVNAETAFDPASLKKIAHMFQLCGNRGIICFFDTRREGEGSHGNGRPNDLDLVARAWKSIHQTFRTKRAIRYEIFNEPFGYPKTAAGARLYLKEMRSIIRKAGLWESRCLLNGLGYADNVRLVSEAGWKGDLAYHFYPIWLPDLQRTQENFSNRVINDLTGLGDRVHVTEFGAHLGRGDVYNRYTADGSVASQDTNVLRGLHDALVKLKKSGHGVAATYFWHGWNNNDTYDFWKKQNRPGAFKVLSIQKDD